MASVFRNDKVFIIPTRSGGVFLVGTLIMLLLGAGYSNNLINLLGFFMLSLMFVGMTLTNFQIKELSVEGIDVEPSFAQGNLSAQVLIKNPTAVARYGVNPEFEDLKVEPRVGEPTVIRAQSVSRVNFVHKVKARGKYEAKRLEMNCVHPLGLFFTWKFIPIEFSFFVYPKPSFEIPLPTRFNSGEAEGVQRPDQFGGDDFRGHRSYVPGDSARHIDWKAFARGRSLMIKELDEGDLPELVLDWEMLLALDDEAKLSQLTGWIIEAFKSDLSFSLSTPKFKSKPGIGPVHAQKCLEALAIYALE